ncbi:MerR family transcriptional regulator [Sediminibacillus massiliensis]|uniref:MerR family transcriptional regulator n=1 Tax=Sediminibacillus massiliensis TaxID=1926277 RepID=UPI0009888F21|nr:MerR family transcriptional regulator [Sediminibacillus massiliensis]
MSKQMDGQAEEKDRNNTNYVSISEASEWTKIPNATLKRYILNHEHIINFKKHGREYRVRVSDLEKLKLIRKLYSEGLKKEAVNERLESEGLPVTITLPSGNEGRNGLISVNQELHELKNNFKSYMQLQEQKRQEEMRLIQEKFSQLEQDNLELKRIINERDVRMIDHMNKSMEETKKSYEEAAAAKGQQKGFWKRLFQRE